MEKKKNYADCNTEAALKMFMERDILPDTKWRIDFVERWNNSCKQFPNDSKKIGATMEKLKWNKKEDQAPDMSKPSTSTHKDTNNQRKNNNSNKKNKK